MTEAEKIHWVNHNNNRFAVRCEDGVWKSRIYYGDGAVHEFGSADTLERLLDQAANDIGPIPPGTTSPEFAEAHRRVWANSGNPSALRYYGIR